jgi:hypothetical protein
VSPLKTSEYRALNNSLPIVRSIQSWTSLLDGQISLR